MNTVGGGDPEEDVAKGLTGLFDERGLPRATGLNGLGPAIVDRE